MSLASDAMFGELAAVRPSEEASARLHLSPWQTTISSPITVAGCGMHTGTDTRVTVRPAPANAGISLVYGGMRVPARASSVSHTQRCTSLSHGAMRVDTVEHLLSALYGLGIDNAEIEVEGPEIPILDGSALPWVESFLRAGIEDLSVPATILRLTDPIALYERGSWLVATPADTFSLTCVTEFDHPLLGKHVETFHADPELYAREIAPARTFGFSDELDSLRQAGLARGGSLENALIVYDDHFSDRLRVPNECQRHKVLDLWGDLSLVGGRLHAAITAIKPGHRANAAFAGLLAERAVRVSPNP